MRATLLLAVAGCAETVGPPGRPDPGQLAFEVPPFVVAAPEQVWSSADENPEHHAALAWLPDATLAIAYSRMPFGPQSTSWVQLADDDGVPIPGTLTAVEPTLTVAKPDVIAADDGRVFVGTQEMNARRIRLSALDPSGVLPAGSVVVATGPHRTQGNNSVDLTRLGGGETLACWYAARLGPSQTGRYYHRLFDDALAPLTPPMVLARVNDLGTAPPEAAALPDGGYVIAWVDAELASSTLVITRFAGSPPVASPAVALHGDPVTVQFRPSIDANDRGELAVAWNEYQGVVPWTGHVLFTDPDGTELLPAFTPVEGVVDEIVAHFLGDDHVFVAWTTPTALHAEIWFALYGFPDGAELVPPTSVTDPALTSSRPAVAVRQDEDGEWKVATSWEAKPDVGARDIRGIVFSFLLESP